MRARSCTIDSSCLIALDHLDLVPQLSLLFSIVLVPQRVRAEISKLRSARDRLQNLFNAYDFLRRCDGYDQGTVDFLLAERIRQGWQDRGEVEAVVQASQFGASVLVDDRWGRELAGREDLDCHGTLWILERFYELGLLSSAALRGCLESLRRSETRLPWETVNEILAQIGEQPLAPD